MIKKSAIQFLALTLILAICSCAPVTIDTVPTGAAVYSADGQTQLGTTPYNTSIFVSDKNFTVRKDRYFDEPVNLNFDSARNIELKLRPTPVLVYSKPDAQIYPAGSETALGKTPMKVPVYAKERTYTLKAADYYDQDIKVSADSIDPLVVKLERRPIVTLSAVPSGVEVYENGSLIGTAPVRQEILASRTFELRKAGYFTKSVTLTGAPPYEMTAELKPFPVITVAATPADAQIYRAGAVAGKAPFKLAVGEKTVLEVRADRYYPQSVTLTPESPAQVNVALKAMPYVTINSEPAGAELFIGGKSSGITPVELLIEKDTVVELRKEGFIAKSATLTGADKQVTVTLEAVPPPPPAVQAAAEPGAKASAVTAPEVQAAKNAPAKSNKLLWAGVIIVAAAIAGFFIIKRKKQQ
ncbi:MAG TPA: PEGA domain-containing protein [Pontiellaceae bacterium]|nr:PEGA domain-containing protein [Pontiellaceae bacterium]